MKTLKRKKLNRREAKMSKKGLYGFEKEVYGFVCVLILASVLFTLIISGISQNRSDRVKERCPIQIIIYGRSWEENQCYDVSEFREIDNGIEFKSCRVIANVNRGLPYTQLDENNVIIIRYKAYKIIRPEGKK